MKDLVMSKAAVLSMFKDLSTSIDLDALQSSGVIKKRSGAWFDVLDPEALPLHARRQVVAFKTVRRPGVAGPALLTGRCRWTITIGTGKGLLRPGRQRRRSKAR